MKVKAVVHEAEEGGYWAEVPAIPGCATQGETMEELLGNVHEAIEACLSVDLDQPESDSHDRVTVEDRFAETLDEASRPGRK